MAKNSDNNLVDVSHTVEHGLVTYKGLPAPIICDYLSREESKKHYAEGTQFHIGKIEMVANTGLILIPLSIVMPMAKTFPNCPFLL